MWVPELRVRIPRPNLDVAVHEMMGSECRVCHLGAFGAEGQGFAVFVAELGWLTSTDRSIRRTYLKCFTDKGLARGGGGHYYPSNDRNSQARYCRHMRKARL